MATIREQRDALAAHLKSIISLADSEGRELNASELSEIETGVPRVKDFDQTIKRSDDAQVLRKELVLMGSRQDGDDDREDQTAQGKTLGDHIAKHIGALISKNRAPGASVSAPEFLPAKAATDPQITTGLTFPQIDTSVVYGFRRQPTIADLLGSGSLSSQSITYFVEGAREGAYTTVAEGGAKPQLHYLYSTLTESLTKIAGYIKLSDEMVNDVAFLVSEINSRLLYDLQIFEEDQLLNGNGTAPNLRGLLNRSGVQTETAATAADNADALFRAITKVQTATGMLADGLVIHPTDYQKIRLTKDLNGQYFAGGPFSGPYGVGGVPYMPPIWGLKTIVTSAIAAGTALVGNYAQSSTVYRKGGVSVSSTNSNVDDFIKNLITVRAEERLALACRVPAAYVKTTLL